MAKIVAVGIDQLAKQFSDVADSTGRIAKKSLYEGTGFMADKLRNATENLTSEEQRKHRSKAVLGYEKEALLNGLTVEKFKDNRALDCVETSVTFHGRSEHRTKNYPDGVPTILLARAINKGTAFRTANRFFPNTVNRNRKDAEAMMVKTAEAEIRKILK